MKKTRTTKQLLRVLAKGVKKYMIPTPLYGGMCPILVDMELDEMISEEEYNILLRYIQGNKPDNVGVAYWYTIGHKEPRLEWIKQQIAKL